MEEEIDIKELIIALWRKKVVILIVTCIFLALGFMLYGRSNTESQNVSTLIVNSGKIESNCFETDFMLSRGTSKELDGVTTTYKLTIDAGVITNLNKFATSKNFLESILSDVNLTNPIKVEELQDHIVILGNGTSDIITLLVTYGNEDEAAEISNRILIELTNKVSKLYKIDELVVIDGPKKLDKEELEELEKTINSDETIVEQGKEASQDDVANKPSKKKVVLVAMIGFVLACGTVIIVELFNSSIRNQEQLEKATDLRTLVRIPRNVAKANEKIDLLRVGLSNYKTIIVTSAEKLDGKSFVASNLVKSYEASGKKSILFSIEDFNEEKLNELESQYDAIIIDAKEVLDSASTLNAIKLAKNTILVCSERKTKLENVIRAKNSIESVGGNLVGTVLNNSIQK